MQVACIEALARLVTKSKRPTFAEKWFPDKKFASAFLAIQDLNFDKVHSINISYQANVAVINTMHYAVKQFLSSYFT